VHHVLKKLAWKRVNIISMIPNNNKKKINMPFSYFCSAGRSLQFVKTDSQTLCHNFSFRILSLYSFNFFYKGGLLSTSYTTFSTSSTTNIAICYKAQGLNTLLQPASNYLVASAHGQAWTCSLHHYQQQFRCFENRSGCSNRKVASAHVLIQSCFLHPGNKKFEQLKLPVHTWPKTHPSGLAVGI
jgi:hypothetical protein